VFIGTAHGVTTANETALRQLGYASLDALNQDEAGRHRLFDARDGETGDPIAHGHDPFARALAGERAVRELLPERSWVIRTAWVYGESGGNFVRTMVRLEGQKDTLDVVDDQRGSPTWSRDLAAGVIALAEAGPRPGIYHCTNSGDTTWYGLTRAIFAELGADPERVRPTTTDKYPRPAPRPAYSVLSPAGWVAAGLPAPRPWSEALHAAFTEVGDKFRPV
jgi:dTDP-4-dehydrorhamnose reductase